MWGDYIFYNPDGTQNFSLIWNTELERFQAPHSTAIAWIHTHPVRPTPRSYDFNFSYVDLNFAYQSGLPGFLITPNGEVLRTEPINTVQLGLGSMHSTGVFYL